MVDLRTVTIRQLRALQTTVGEGSVTRAAQRLNVSAPAVTAQLKLLEDLVGEPLLERTANGYLATAAGLELLRAAREVESALHVAAQRLGDLRRGAAGSISFGAVSTAKYFAPAIVAAFLAEWPDIRVRLVISNRGEIVEALHAGAMDLYLMGRPPEGVPLVSVPLGDHPHVLIASPRHRLAGTDGLMPDDLAGERILAREPGSGTRTLMERFLERHQLLDRCETVEMGTNETIKQAVMAGLGVALISGHTCVSELAESKLVSLRMRGFPLIRQWYLIERKDRPLSMAAARMKEFLLANRAELLPRATIT